MTMPWGRTAEGDPVGVHVLANDNGVEARVLDYGGILLSMRVPDRDGRFADVTLGYEGIEGYLDDPAYLGALIGRFGNRIAGGRFTLDGRTHRLPLNDGPNHLHGGPGGFHRALWSAAPLDVPGGAGIVLSHASPAGDQGYPGRLEARVTLALTPDDALVLMYHATADAATPVNLTQHSYWNLAGHGAGDILDHLLTLDADHFLPVDATMIPTGEVRTVDGTPFDFRRPTPIGARIDAGDPQLEPGRGYDHTWVLDAPPGEPARAARLVDPASGRSLDVLTTQPGIQVYTGNWLDGLEGKGGARYGRRAGIALETQHFPDSPNRPAFPCTILRPGEEYRSTTTYRFGIA